MFYKNNSTVYEKLEMIQDEQLSAEHDIIENLCLRPNIFHNRSAPPFPLFLEPKKFLAAQVPGIQPTETVIIDCALKDPSTVNVITEIIGYERKFFKNFEILRTQIMPKIKGTQFESLDMEVMLKLTMVSMNHKKLMMSINGIMSNSSEDQFIKEFIRIFANQPDLIAAHSDYDRRLVIDEQLVSEFSIQYSQEFSEMIYGKSIIQLMKSTKEWVDFMSKKAFDLAKKLPDSIYGDEKSTLTQFATLTKLIISSV